MYGYRGNVPWLVCGLLMAAWLLSMGPLWAAIQVRDDAGHRLRLEQAATRVVSLAPHITELLFAMGAGAQLVGVSQYSDYPVQARQLPRIGSGQGLDLERIVALQPDLVIAWQSGNAAHALERLEAMGIPVFRSEPGNLDAIAATLERFGQLTGRVGQAQEAARQFRADLNVLRETYAEASRVRVFMEIWQQPLMTLGGTHILSDALSLCGGVNVFATQPQRAFSVDLEAVLAANPEVILASDTAAPESQWRTYWQRWPSLSAVAHGHLFQLSADLLHRPTPRMLQGVARLCAILDQVRRERGSQGPVEPGWAP